MYNKKYFKSINNKKTLHKTRRGWVICSTALLALLGSTAVANKVNNNANASSVTPQTNSSVVTQQPSNQNHSLSMESQQAVPNKSVQHNTQNTQTAIDNFHPEINEIKATTASEVNSLETPVAVQKNSIPQPKSNLVESSTASSSQPQETSVLASRISSNVSYLNNNGGSVASYQAKATSASNVNFSDQSLIQSYNSMVDEEDPKDANAINASYTSANSTYNEIKSSADLYNGILTNASDQANLSALAGEYRMSVPQYDAMITSDANSYQSVGSNYTQLSSQMNVVSSYANLMSQIAYNNFGNSLANHYDLLSQMMYTTSGTDSFTSNILNNNIDFDESNILNIRNSSYPKYELAYSEATINYMNDKNRSSNFSFANNSSVAKSERTSLSNRVNSDLNKITTAEDSLQTDSEDMSSLMSNENSAYSQLNSVNSKSTSDSVLARQYGALANADLASLFDTTTSADSTAEYYRKLWTSASYQGRLISSSANSSRNYENSIATSTEKSNLNYLTSSDASTMSSLRSLMANSHDKNTKSSIENSINETSNQVSNGISEAYSQASADISANDTSASTTISTANSITNSNASIANSLYSAIDYATYNETDIHGIHAGLLDTEDYSAATSAMSTLKSLGYATPNNVSAVNNLISNIASASGSTSTAASEFIKNNQLALAPSLANSYNVKATSASTVLSGVTSAMNAFHSNAEEKNGIQSASLSIAAKSASSEYKTDSQLASGYKVNVYNNAPKFITFTNNARLHSDPNFSSDNAIASINKNSAYQVTGVSFGSNGITRYQINDNGRVGYVTSNPAYVKNTYAYAKSNNRVSVKTIAPICLYNSPSFDSQTRVKTLDAGTVLNGQVVSNDPYGGFTRIQLDNGDYITANTNFVNVNYLG